MAMYYNMVMHYNMAMYYNMVMNIITLDGNAL